MVNCDPRPSPPTTTPAIACIFEPLTYEDVMAVYEHEAQRRADRSDRAVRRSDAAESGAAVEGRRSADYRDIAESIDLAEDRRRFGKLLEEL